MTNGNEPTTKKLEPDATFGSLSERIEASRAAERREREREEDRRLAAERQELEAEEARRRGRQRLVNRLQKTVEEAKKTIAVNLEKQDVWRASYEERLETDARMASEQDEIQRTTWKAANAIENLCLQLGLNPDEYLKAAGLYDSRLWPFPDWREDNKTLWRLMYEAFGEIIKLRIWNPKSRRKNFARYNLNRLSW